MRINVRNRGQVVNPEDLKLLNLHDQNLERRSFSGEFDSISVARSALKNCIFKEVRCESVSLGGGLLQSIYQDCIFQDCKFRFFAVGDARLVQCKFINCDLSNVFALDLELIDCQFIKTTIRRGVFHGTVYNNGPIKRDMGRTINEFHGNDFSTAELIDIDFRGGIDLKKQALPTSSDYLYVPDIRAATKALDDMDLPASDPELEKIRKRLKASLYIYNDDIQKDQLLRVNFPPMFCAPLTGGSAS